MKSKLLILSGVIVAATILLGLLTRFSYPSNPQKAAPNPAYEALNQLALARAYPFKDIPQASHYAAWAALQPQTRQADPDSLDVLPWEGLGPKNIAGRTLKLAFNPQNPKTIYAGSASGGLWRTSTAGFGEEAWEYVPTGFPILGVSSIAFPPGDSMTIYIGTGEVYNHEAAGTGAAYRNTRGSYGMGILKSTDGGKSWQKSLDWTYAQSRGIWDIKIAQGNPNILYAATTEGVYKSTDAGNSWVQVHQVVMATSLLIHPDDPNRVLVGCGNFASPGFGIYASKDGGGQWTKISSSLPTNFRGKIQLENYPLDPDLIYASIGNGFGFSDGKSWLCRSENFGESWSIQDTTDYSRWQGWFAHDIAVNPLDPDDLAIVGINVWKSSNAGVDIEQVTVGGVGFANPPIGGPDGAADYVHSDCHDVIYHPNEPGVFYVASDGGVHYTQDNGETFRSLNGGFQTVQFYNGTSNSFQDTSFYLGGLQDNGTIGWNGDETWRRIAGGDGSWSAIYGESDSIFFVSSQRLFMRGTQDRGQTFQNVAPPDTLDEITAFIAPFVISPNTPGLIYAGSNYLFKSTDWGVNWKIMNVDPVFIDRNPIFSMAVSPENHDILYLATAPTTIFNGTRGEVYMTKDGGESWNRITGNLPDRYPTDMAVNPRNEAEAYITFSGFGTGHLFRTTDYGQTWEDISWGLPDVPTNAIAVDPEFPANIYVGNDLGVFASIDGGASWIDYNDGLFEATMIFDLIVSPANRKLRAASHGNGAFQRDLLEIEGVLQIPGALNEDKPFELLAFPNPTRNYIRIQFKLAERGDIKAQIIDLRGREVLDVFDEVKAEGIHSAEVNLASLAAGIYFIRLSAGDKIATQKFAVKR